MSRNKQRTAAATDAVAATAPTTPAAPASLSYVTPTEFVDVFPTLIDIAELKPLDYLDGNSLSPLMLGKQQKVKDFGKAYFYGYSVLDIGN